mmetsp:Transcript_50114/g.162239  ORF Transcript_50114/g.162239 Transcript_50114/m.162239 type:complete len:85 (-) Transcript_50114:1275-1529(-)
MTGAGGAAYGLEATAASAPEDRDRAAERSEPPDCRRMEGTEAEEAPLPSASALRLPPPPLLPPRCGALLELWSPRAAGGSRRIV